MSNLKTQIPIPITPEDVLRGQGADPEKIKSRNPRLYSEAKRALQDGYKLLQPVYVTKTHSITEVRHENLILDNNVTLSGGSLTKHLLGSDYIVSAVCTVGDSIEDYADRVSSDDIVRGLALYGVGSAAVESLANIVCRQIEINAQKDGLETTIPLSPGMIGWPVEEGQPVLFELLDISKIDVRLTQDFMMIPKKSLSMIIGIGSDINKDNTTCDYCSMKQICRYKDHYSHT